MLTWRKHRESRRKTLITPETTSKKKPRLSSCLVYRPPEKGHCEGNHPLQKKIMKKGLQQKASLKSGGGAPSGQLKLQDIWKPWGGGGVKRCREGAPAQKALGFRRER